ncbi:hypothetical protein H0X09_02260 [Candidatus Saccharibacteria bacterium]|nr:hypothetical protein [Candidatus Saccharibacteria bacterium]
MEYLNGQKSTEIECLYDTSETHKGPMWSILGGEYTPPNSSYITIMNLENPSLSQNSVEVVMHCMELAGVVKNSSEVAKSLEHFNDDTETTLFNRDADSEVITNFNSDQELARHIYEAVVLARDICFDYTQTQMEELRENTKHYTFKKVPVLKELRYMTDPSGGTKTRNMQSMIEPTTAWIGEAMLRVLIAKEVGLELPQSRYVKPVE